jgi:hypothetical protein
MGTRSLIHIKDGKKTIATIYQQYDGYPTGVGKNIKKILNWGRVKVLNGYSGSDKTPHAFNGMGCLAAYLIGELKDKKIGNVYLMAPNTKDVGEEFIYTISQYEYTVKLKVIDVYENKVLFNGVLNEFCGERAEGRTLVEIALT